MLVIAIIYPCQKKQLAKSLFVYQYVLLSLWKDLLVLAFLGHQKQRYSDISSRKVLSRQ